MVDNTDSDEVGPQGTRSPGADATWRPVTRASTHELVIEAIEDQIMTGALVVGDLLPPERELASRLSVSRAGVREAIRVLEGHGVLRSDVGSGRGAGTFVASLPSAALARFLRLHVALANFRIQEVVEARIILEQASASLAAERANADALAELERLVAIMDEPGVSREEFNDADTAFHVAIAEAGGNTLFSDMTGAIRASLRAPILEAFTKVTDWDAMASMLRSQHHGILEAIAQGQGARAGELTATHIREAAAALPELPEA
ncbi:FadR/GntR family transcriptional regulator [Brachybacterium fresconis]|uniref:GntR family transcriptional repressor for pyruvate dehydrogenase complex n=1 Tax=Brachybacterium fresconis TaxID=173363 RepID=A0ABS4YQ76_9MICO|nr:FadR/GntR family transcriptional regulator [Brachybacterium fresconis]MBP2410942.1 GntR family transcriptional repressor for pyruvate dehydrogenase complex [Brachybacterium fresconis]